jgi:hypothetical protein
MRLRLFEDFYSKPNSGPGARSKVLAKVLVCQLGHHFIAACHLDKDRGRFLAGEWVDREGRPVDGGVIAWYT